MAASRRNTGHRPDLVKWGLALAAAVAVAAIVAMAYRRFHHPQVDVTAYPVRGIDVSRHNGDIDWNAVARAGIEFVFVKATEGTAYTDPMLIKHYRGAAQAGLKVGCYHFFRKGSDGESQARHFLGAVAGLDLDLPLVVDVEDSDNDNIDNALASRRLTQMVEALESSGRTVMIYTNGDGYRTYYRPLLAGRPLWLSSFKAPEAVSHTGHRVQQYSHWGTVDGVSTDVDLDIFVGTREQWLQWLELVSHTQSAK